MSKYKNCLLSLGSYVLASFLFYLTILSDYHPVLGDAGFYFFWTSVVVVILGLLLAIKGKKLREPVWARYILIILGLIMLLRYAYILLVGLALSG